jgi:F0F1-type ATP synthase assembly protein I
VVLAALTSNRGPGRGIGEGYKYLGLGMQFAGGIILFVVGGYLMDRWLGTMPAFTIAGTLFGATLSFVNVYLKLKALTDAERKQRERAGDR